MISMTNANMKNLSTTTAPAPPKSWDKQDRAKAAAVRELGPQAVPEFDFTVYKCDGRWLWKALSADKRPPISAQQVKANGGRKATEAMVNDADRIAGEAVAAAALVKKAADKVAAKAKGTIAEKIAAEVAANAGEHLAKAKIDHTPDKNGVPAFLSRGGGLSVEEHEALIAKHKKTTGPGRQIKNPPNVKDAKKRAEKKAGQGVGHVAREAILAGKTNEEALAEVMRVFPKCNSNVGCMSWYRNKMRKDGLLKDGKQPARPTKAKGKK